LLKSKKVQKVNVNDQTIKEWSIYKCLYAEIDSNDDKYLLVTGKYYKVDAAYKSKIESDYTVDATFTLPDWEKNDRENIYNGKVADSDNNYFRIKLDV